MNKPVPRPKRIEVEGETVVVEWNVPLGRLVEGYARAADHSLRHIRVAPGNMRHGDRHILLHEVAHELWIRSGLRRFLSKKTEELVIDSLMPWVLETIRKNKELRDFLFEEDGGGGG